MDPISGLKAELFRPLVTILVPGIVAAFPFALIVYKRFPLLKSVFESPVGIGAIVLFLGILLGMVMENFGSWLELFQWRVFVRTPERTKEWGDYLELKAQEEVVGQRYLETMHLRLKFELSMFWAIAFFAIGANWFNYREGAVPADEMLWFTCLIACFWLLFFVEAIASARVLAAARKSVINACRSSKPRASM